MDVAVSAAQWVVGKALAPIADGVLEAWAASEEFGPNIEALKLELLYVQGVLNNTRGREIDNPALNELLQKLRDMAHNAEDVLDRLDYFRIQDELYGTCESANEHAKGCIYNLVFNARHTAKDVGKLLGFSARSSATNPRNDERQGERDARQQVLCCPWPCARPRMARNGNSVMQHSNQANEEASGCIGKLAAGTCNTIRSLGKHLPCSSFSPAMSTRQKKHAKEIPKLVFDRVDLSRTMGYIVEQLQPICAKVSTILNLELLNSSYSTAPLTATKNHPMTTSDGLETKIYGRNRIVNGILCDITHGKYCDKVLTVLPIVGPGGIGKTTLTQNIYHNLEVKKHFQVKAWICVSVNFNVDKLMLEIEKAIPVVQNEKKGLEIEKAMHVVKNEKKGTTRELIEQRLKSKRLLLILDDIWKCTDEEWKRLLEPFEKSQVNGNIILVTTRFPALAKMVKTTNRLIELEGLGSEDFKKLFYTFAFGNEQPRQEYTGLLDTGDEIIEKLKGSPLAAKTVGRLLRNHLDLHSWRRVLESKEWELQNGDHDIMPALKLSYQYLSFHLQQCFFYCALFPEDYWFDSKELVHFWIGLDILHSRDENKSVEQIGDSTLNELVNYGFFKKDVTDGHAYYIVHDLLHDLALKSSSNECLNVHRSNIRSVQTRPSVRHLSINIDNDSEKITDEKFIGELRKLKTKLKVGNLQTLMIFTNFDDDSNGRFADSINNILAEAKALRVLRLPVMSCSMESIPYIISGHVHLRYLRLETEVVDDEIDLPSTLSRFYHLKILDLLDWDGSLFLPRDMNNLVKLCHFSTKHNKLHSDISDVGKLKFLQELKVFQVNKESQGFEPKQLENLSDLRELGLYNLEKIRNEEEAAEAQLLYKIFLHKLTLEWDPKRPNTEFDVETVVLENLQPHRDLQVLCIRGHRGRSCPTWLGDELAVKGLRCLNLFGVFWEKFPSFCQMWDLSKLKLQRIATIKEFGLEQSFCKLAKLTLLGLRSLEKLVARDTHLFPLLQVLIIKDCPKLSKFPFEECFPKLKRFEIVNCCEILPLPPIPWNQSLCSVKIKQVGSSLCKLEYSKSSSTLDLELTPNNDIRSLDQVLVFSNLTKLRKLNITNCPTLKLKDLRMLTSLKKLSSWNSGDSNALVEPLGGHVDNVWQLPIKRIEVSACDTSGKEMTLLVSHLPKLSYLEMIACSEIKQLVVGVEDTQATDEHHQTGDEVDEDKLVSEEDTREKDDDVLVEEEEEEEEEEEDVLVSEEEEDGLLKDEEGEEEEEEDVLVSEEEEDGLLTDEEGEEEDGLLSDDEEGEENKEEDELVPTEEKEDALVSEEEEEEEEEGEDEDELVSKEEDELVSEEDGLLVLPAHLCNSLQKLKISGQMVIHPLHALQALCKLWLWSCSLVSYSSSCYPFPSSLQSLCIDSVEGMETLEPLLNLTSLTELHIEYCGENLRWEGLWPLHTRGKLSKLIVRRSPKFFAGSNATWGQQNEQEKLLLSSSSKLEYLDTDYLAGVLIAPICSLLSSSLTKLHFRYSFEEERSTEEAIHLLTSLEELSFNLCRKLQCLPAGLSKLTNLKSLHIYSCPALQSLPKDGLPSSLQELNVSGDKNEELTQQCRQLIGTISEITLD